jgi:hypothetical protein
MLILHEKQLHRVLRVYVKYFNLAQHRFIGPYGIAHPGSP